MHNLLYGLIAAAIGLVLTAVTQGQRIFIGLLVIGAIYSLIGLVQVIAGAVRSRA